MSVKLYQLFCDTCSYKRITDGTDVADLVELSTSPVPGGVPYIDPYTSKVINPPPSPQKKKFKCPNCGFVIQARQIKKNEHTNETNFFNGSETSTSR